MPTEVLTIPVTEVRPMDSVGGREWIREVRHGLYDFGTWPDHERARGVEIIVGPLWMDTEWVVIDGDYVAVKYPRWGAMTATRYKADITVRVVRGLSPPTRHTDAPPKPPTPAEIAAAAAAQVQLEEALKCRP